VGRLENGKRRQFMNKYVEIIIIAFLALASNSSAGNNTITHHIVQTIDGELVPERSNWFQNAGLGSMVMGEDNLLSVHRATSGQQQRHIHPREQPHRHHHWR
jgi:hypothetical protein